MILEHLHKCLRNILPRLRTINHAQNLSLTRTLVTKTFSRDIRKCSSRYDHFSSPLIKTKTVNLFTGVHNSKDSVTITFIDRVGAPRVVEANIDDTLLDVAKDNDIDGIEGACDGTLACSTCHCIFKEEDFDRLELSDITEDELDMLDLAYGLTDTSRLGCAVDVTKEMDGVVITVPMSTFDVRD